MKVRKCLTVYLFFLLILLSNQTAFARTSELNSITNRSGFALKFYRTELYFGTGKPDGTAVTDEEWMEFLTAKITPKFPAGLTVLEGYGQFKDTAGKIVKEKSRCLILLYSKKDKAINNRKIEEIRTTYRLQFQQESVLRIDFRHTVQVSF